MQRLLFFPLVVSLVVVVSVAPGCSDDSDCASNATCVGPSPTNEGGTGDSAPNSGNDGGGVESGPSTCGDPNTPCCAGACSGGAVCNGGTCACPANKTACGSACVDVQTDPNHCGRCNRSCLGTTCAAGLCKAATVLTLPQRAEAMAIDGGRIYYTHTGAVVAGGVFSVKVDGTDPKTHYQLPAGQGCQGVATAKGKAFFTCNGDANISLYSCDLPACTTPPATPTLVRPSLGSLIGFVGADTATGKVFYPVGTVYNSSTGGGVLDGSGAQVGGVNQADPKRVTVIDGFIYWLNSGTFAANSLQPNGGVRRASVANPTSDAPVLAPAGTHGVVGESQFAVDTFNAYLVTYNRTNGERAIEFVPLLGGTQVGMTPKFFGGGGAVASDGVNVYFGDGLFDETAVRYCPRVGACMATLLAPNERDLRALTFDNDNVIWSTTTAIRRVAKP